MSTPFLREYATLILLAHCSVELDHDMHADQIVLEEVYFSITFYGIFHTLRVFEYMAAVSTCIVGNGKVTVRSKNFCGRVILKGYS